MDYHKTASQRIIDSMDAVLSTRAKAAIALRTAIEVCTLSEDGDFIKIQSILEVAGELDGSQVLH